MNFHNERGKERERVSGEAKRSEKGKEKKRLRERKRGGAIALSGARTSAVGCAHCAARCARPRAATTTRPTLERVDTRRNRGKANKEGTGWRTKGRIHPLPARPLSSYIVVISSYYLPADKSEPALSPRHPL